jgi:hypothetical protein
MTSEVGDSDPRAEGESANRGLRSAATNGSALPFSSRRRPQAGAYSNNLITIIMINIH